MSPSYWTDDYSAIDTITKFIKGSKQPAPLFLSVANEKGMGVEKLRKNLSQLKPTNWQFK
ncbi:MAG: alpha/beta hydrolase, partial [Gammaproteobacteria bacterium]|nr:alpha/beta hydrolase [Gammaproteobacteria bacterium]